MHARYPSFAPLPADALALGQTIVIGDGAVIERVKALLHLHLLLLPLGGRYGPQGRAYGGMGGGR